MKLAAVAAALVLAGAWLGAAWSTLVWLEWACSDEVDLA